MGAPNWQESRFFLPNEDAAVVRRALGSLGPVHNALFVLGSGILPLDVLPHLAKEATLDCIDLSDFQQTYAQKLFVAIRAAQTPKELWQWFTKKTFPQLNDYYAARHEHYTLDGIETALKELFHIRFFFDQEIFAQVQARLSQVVLHRGNALSWLAQMPKCDFVHLSNILDYAPRESVYECAATCAQRGAAVFYIVTSVCADSDGLLRLWYAAGYRESPITPELQAMNKALGATTSTKPWMRTGSVHLLLPSQRP